MGYRIISLIEDCSIGVPVLYGALLLLQRLDKPRERPDETLLQDRREPGRSSLDLWALERFPFGDRYGGAV